MIEFQFDNKFWTSSFKKLLASTEDDKKLRSINRILRKALGASNEDVIKRCEPKLTYEQNESLDTTKRIKLQKTKKVIIETNNNIEYPPDIQTTDLDEVELCTAHIYETIGAQRPIITQYVNVKDRPLPATPIMTTPIKQIYANFPEENNYSFINNSTPNKTTSPLQEKIQIFEALSRDFNTKPVRLSRKKSLARRIFEDENGDVLSPIKKQVGNYVQDRFIVNLYESRAPKRRSDDINPSANIVTEISNANMTADKILERSIGRRINRIVSTSVMDAFDAMETSMDAVKDLDELAQSLGDSNPPSPVSNKSVEPIYATPNKSLKKRRSIIPDDTEHDLFLKLKQQADIQCKVMKQASSALEICKTSTKTQIESEIEAEKILLTASCKYEQILQEIRQGHYENPLKTSNVGTVNIRDIKIPLKQRKDPEWFICIVSDDKQLYHTDAVQVAPNVDVLEFQDYFIFDDLDASFRIKVEVYCMKMRKHKNDSKYRINKRASTLCRKSRKLLYTDLQTHTMIESNIPLSSFNLCGSLKMTVNDLTRNTEWALTLPEESPLTPNISINANITSVKMDTNKRGFLTIGSDNGYLWNRRWCVLEGTKLKFWNYPNESDSKPPIEVINLDTSLGEVKNAKRSYCPRPRTLLLEANEAKYFLNADSMSDMHDWRNKLNGVFCTLDSWRMMKRHTDV